MSDNKEIVESQKSKIQSVLRECNIPEHMLNDAFCALLISLVRQPLMSSDCKYFVIQSMYDNLNGLHR
jgi:hypothetical protein